MEVTGSSQTKLQPFILPAQTAVISENSQKGSDRIVCLVTKETNAKRSFENQSINEPKSKQRGLVHMTNGSAVDYFISEWLLWAAGPCQRCDLGVDRDAVCPLQL